MTAPTPIIDPKIHEVDVTKLVPFEGNPRKGDVDTIAQSLTINGQFRPILVRKETMEVLVGNHTLLAAKQLGWAKIKVTYAQNLTDEGAKRIVLADNRISDLATYNNLALLELMKEVAVEGDGLLGTGYEEDDFANLLRQIESQVNGALDRYAEWQGMPEYEQDSKQSAFKTMIHFLTEQDADAFFAMIDRPKHATMWWPEDDGLVGSDSKYHYVQNGEEQQ